MSSRPSHPPLTGVRNFRDMGGAALAGGARLRRGALYRSGHFGGATEADWRVLEGLGLARVIDLRRPSERRRDPGAWPDHFGCAHVHVEQDDGGEAPHLAFLRDTDITADSTRDYMLAAYRRIPFEAPHRPVFRAAFEHLSAPGGAAVIHCAAGKDRTGILCALILEALDAPRETVMDDYLASNAALGEGARLGEIAERIGAALGRSLDPRALRPMLGVEEEYLRAAYDEIRDRAGGLDAYLGEWLGVTPEVRARLRERLTEPGDG